MIGRTSLTIGPDALARLRRSVAGMHDGQTYGHLGREASDALTLRALALDLEVSG